MRGELDDYSFVDHCPTCGQKWHPEALRERERVLLAKVDELRALADWYEKVILRVVKVVNAVAGEGP